MNGTLDELLKLLTTGLLQTEALPRPKAGDEDPEEFDPDDPEDPEDVDDPDSDTDVEDPESGTADEYELKRQAVAQGHEAITTFKALGKFEKPAVEKINILKDPNATEKEKDDAKAWIYSTYDALIDAYIKYYIRGILFKVKRQFSNSEIQDMADNVKDMFWQSMLLRKHSPPIIVSYDPAKGKARGKTIDPETGEKLGDVAGFLRGNLETVNRFNVPKEIEDKLKHVSFQKLGGKGDDDTSFDPAAPIVAIRPGEPTKEEYALCNRITPHLLKLADWEGEIPASMLPGMQVGGKRGGGEGIPLQDKVKMFMYYYGLGYKRLDTPNIAKELGKPYDVSTVSTAAEAVRDSIAMWLKDKEDRNLFLSLTKKLRIMGGRSNFKDPFCPTKVEEILISLASLLKEWSNE